MADKPTLTPSDLDTIRQDLRRLEQRAKAAFGVPYDASLTIEAGHVSVFVRTKDYRQPEPQIIEFGKTPEQCLAKAFAKLGELEAKAAADIALLARTLDVDGLVLPEAREGVS